MKKRKKFADYFRTRTCNMQKNEPTIELPLHEIQKSFQRGPRVINCIFMKMCAALQVAGRMCKRLRRPNIVTRVICQTAIDTDPKIPLFENKIIERVDIRLAYGEHTFSVTKLFNKLKALSTICNRFKDEEL